MKQHLRCRALAVPQHQTPPDRSTLDVGFHKEGAQPNWRPGRPGHPLPSMLTVPAGQASQAEAPTRLVKLPGAQGVEAPEEQLDPGSHGAHCAVLNTVVPSAPCSWARRQRQPSRSATNGKRQCSHALATFLGSSRICLSMLLGHCSPPALAMMFCHGLFLRAASLPGGWGL